MSPGQGQLLVMLLLLSLSSFPGGEYQQQHCHHHCCHHHHRHHCHSFNYGIHCSTTTITVIITVISAIVVITAVIIIVMVVVIVIIGTVIVIMVVAVMVIVVTIIVTIVTISASPHEHRLGLGCEAGVVIVPGSRVGKPGHREEKGHAQGIEHSSEELGLKLSLSCSGPVPLPQEMMARELLVTRCRHVPWCVHPGLSPNTKAPALFQLPGDHCPLQAYCVLSHLWAPISVGSLNMQLPLEVNLIRSVVFTDKEHEVQSG